MQGDTGSPPQRESTAVVCALYVKQSRNMSAARTCIKLISARIKLIRTLIKSVMVLFRTHIEFQLGRLLNQLYVAVQEHVGGAHLH